MSSQKSKKHKKHFYQRQSHLNKRQQQNKQSDSGPIVSLKDNLKGFLVTCNQKEYQCLQESYNILNEAAERIYPVEEDSPGPQPDSNDIEACIQHELATELRFNRRRFLQVKTKCKNLLFIRIQDERIDPKTLMMSIWEELDRNGKQNARYIQRIIPVIRTCKAEKIIECFRQLFDKEADRKVCSFSVQCRIRNNSSFKEKQLQEQIVELVREKRPNWYVGLDQPDCLIQIFIVCKAGTISLLNDYVRYAKYNLVEFIKKKHESQTNLNNKDNVEQDKNSTLKPEFKESEKED